MENDIVYITANDSGGISVTTMLNDDVDGTRLTRALFELSRTTDLTTVFDPEIHTREVIAADREEGFRSVSLLGTCKRSDLPSDRIFRHAWEWEN